MTRKIHLGLAIIGAFALFALALRAGGDTGLTVAQDRSGADAGRLMSQIATPSPATRNDASTTVAQARTPGAGKATTADKKAATSRKANSATRTPTSPGGNFIGGVPRGSFDDEPRRDQDATRGSHADGGA